MTALDAATELTEDCPANRAGRTLVLGLGSPILRDDAVGLHVVRRLAAMLPPQRFAVTEAAVAGLGLLPIIEGWDRLVIVDALVGAPPGTGQPTPGRLHRLCLEDLTACLNLTSSHDAGLPEVLALGAMLGLAMPREVLIFGIEVEDPFSFDERMSPALARKVNAVADEIARQCITL